MPNSIVAEMQSKKWAMEPGSLKAFFERMAGLPANAALPTVAVASTKRKLLVENGTALIAISGVLLKSVPGWLRLYGVDATGYDEIADQVAEAVADENVEGIHLQISSPGGVIDGLADTADAIYSARTIKTVTATIEDLGASAAYWLGSQSSTIDANRTAEIGSIGVFTVYLDFSKADEDAGVRVVVIRSGEHKAMGIDKVTDEQIAAVQENIDSLADNFISAVAAGRNKSADVIRTLATGRLWIAATAQELGLIDGIKEVKTTEGVTIMENDKNSQAEVNTEKITADAQQAAQNDERIRATQLKAEFPDDPEFAIKAVSEGWSVAEAKAEYCDVLKEKVKAVEEQTRQDKETQGAEPLENSGSGDGSTGDFVSAAKELAKAENIKLGDAFKKVAREQPELYAAYKSSLTAA